MKDYAFRPDTYRIPTADEEMAIKNILAYFRNPCTQELIKMGSQKKLTDPINPKIEIMISHIERGRGIALTSSQIENIVHDNTN